jgi:hypothetical protein
LQAQALISCCLAATSSKIHGGILTAKRATDIVTRVKELTSNTLGHELGQIAVDPSKAPSASPGPRRHSASKNLRRELAAAATVDVPILATPCVVIDVFCASEGCDTFRKKDLQKRRVLTWRKII